MEISNQVLIDGQTALAELRQRLTDETYWETVIVRKDVLSNALSLADDLLAEVSRLGKLLRDGTDIPGM